MSFAIRRLNIAEEDALQAALWYEGREPGLGNEFLDEVEIAIRKLSETALLNRVRFEDVRRAPVARFRFYGIYYYIEGNDVVVIAIHHGRKHPRSLETRRKDIHA